MKIKTTLLLAFITAASLVSSQAQYTTNTLSFSGASWSDGGSLNGYFTILYDLTGTPQEVLSMDVTTGNGISDSFVGSSYIYNVDGQADTVYAPTFNATQTGGYEANELTAVSLSQPDEAYFGLFLDWQGSTPTSLYVGTVGGQYSSENYETAPGIRSLNNEGGSAGITPTPEPSTLALAGLGGLITLIAAKRNRARR